MLVALDAMGGDHAPAAIVAGALLARRELGIEIALVGDRAVVEAELARDGVRPSGIEIVHASELRRAVVFCKQQRFGEDRSGAP